MVNSLKDRSRKEYETGENDKTFKKTLNTFLLGIGIFLLCSEWILRRLVKLALVYLPADWLQSHLL